MSKQKKIMQKIRQEAHRLEIPQGISPENMRAKLECVEEGKEPEYKEPEHREPEKSNELKKLFRFPVKQIGAVACMLLLLGAASLGMQWRLQPKPSQKPVEQTEDMWMAEEPGMTTEDEEPGKTMTGVEATTETSFPDITYEEIYAAMLPVWEQQGWFLAEADINSGVRDLAEGLKGEPMALPEATDELAEVPVSEGSKYGYSSTSQKLSDTENPSADTAVGTTNVQTTGVDEGDIVKNDGRYLYQTMYLPTDKGGGYAIQIVDTKNGLKEIARIEGFDGIQEFYVTEDLLIVIENKYLQESTYRQTKSIMEYELCCLPVYGNNYYHEITIYDLSSRMEPKKIKTFTLEGRYESSRVADGYFYGFSRYYATPGEGETDYNAYVPQIDGKALEAEKILLPEDGTGTSYLVLISVKLEEPDQIFKSTAVVSPGDLYYVSGKNIYVTYPKSVDAEEGWVSDKTAILRFAYGEGSFALEAKGEVKGTLENSFSLDEYNDYLRAVSTVREYRLEKLVDERRGNYIGSIIEEERQTNALYVLNADLETVGKIEGLAENERIYSARFLGDTGYFVTFRQTDPLFAVDLTKPEAPQILSELKISGFSEYLHFYGKDRLLGIGMEADENTGAQKGIKLSMFDISDPGNVTEINKLWLEEYNYSEAMYNHRAIMISTQANLFGFEAEGSQKGKYWKEYLVFSYENDDFVTRLKLDTKTDEGYYQSRGTFIGDVFYLLTRDGSVQSYNWKTGQKLESLSIVE